MIPRIYADTSVIGGCLDDEALATIRRVDLLVSWNFRHIVSWHRIRAFNSVNLKLGYPEIEIRTPREVAREEEV